MKGNKNRKLWIYRNRELERYRHIVSKKQIYIDIQEERQRKMQTYRERKKNIQTYRKREIERYRYIGREKQKDIDIWERETER